MKGNKLTFSLSTNLFRVNKKPRAAKEQLLREESFYFVSQKYYIKAA